MLLNAIFFVGGAITSGLLFIFLNRQDPVGELQVDNDKEIVQIAFYSIKDLHAAVHQKQQIKLNVIHKNIEFNITQEKHGL